VDEQRLAGACQPVALCELMEGSQHVTLVVPEPDDQAKAGDHQRGAGIAPVEGGLGNAGGDEGFVPGPLREVVEPEAVEPARRHREDGKDLQRDGDGGWRFVRVAMAAELAVEREPYA